jgi:hypothetical protein
MTQPDKPVSARGARPQLFGEPGAGKSGSPRQPDFGPSILATIDGTPPRRDSRSRDATPLKRVLWMSALALGVVAVYFGVKFGMLPGDAPSSAPLVAAAPATEPVAKLVEPAAPAAPTEQVAPVAQAAPGASAPEGSATIETVAVALMPSASAAEASAPATSVAASLSSIQQTLARSEPTEARKAAKPAAPKEAPARAKERTSPAKDTVVAEARPAAAPSPKPAAKAANDDADLLAAMLPHLKRRGAAPTSPAYERRCGQLAGDAAAECRAKFCNGREGVDAACPSAASR